MQFNYRCRDCGKEKPDNSEKMICVFCGGDIKGQSAGVIGTRDGFGIGKEFVDERSGKEIDNWRSWEKAGFRDKCSTTNHNFKEQVKEQKEKRKGRREPKLKNSSLPL